MRGRIKLGVIGAEEIEVEGHRIEGGVRAVKFEQRAGALAQISLELAIVELTEAEGDVRLVMSDGTRDALVALGWTPPEG